MVFPFWWLTPTVCDFTTWIKIAPTSVSRRLEFHVRYHHLWWELGLCLQLWDKTAVFSKTETQCASLKVKHQVRGVNRSILAILFWLSQHTKTLLPRVRLSWQNYTIMSSGVWKISSIGSVHVPPYPSTQHNLHLPQARPDALCNLVLFHRIKFKFKVCPFDTIEGIQRASLTHTEFEIVI